MSNKKTTANTCTFEDTYANSSTSQSLNINTTSRVFFHSFLSIRKICKLKKLPNPNKSSNVYKSDILLTFAGNDLDRVFVFYKYSLRT